MIMHKRIDSAAETLPLRSPLGRGTAGQLRVRARIARTGVLRYPGRREFRPETEVFDAKSLATLEGAPVVLEHDHKDFVSSSDWRRKSVGHVTDVARDGDYIVGTLVLGDGEAIGAVERGELVELSAGYLAELKVTPGSHAGEAYDCEQHSIRYNHVALLRAGAGRAGRDVKILRTDSDSQREVDDFVCGVAGRARDRMLTRHTEAWRHDGAELTPPKRARLPGSLGSIDPASRSVRIVASTPAPVDGEALVSWDLERFLKNPCILWAHDADDFPIGIADDVKVTPKGLTMRVRFASVQANPLAEQVWTGVQEGLIRAVSVGFEPGAPTQLPDGTIERTKNVLLEVSFVPVGADENAGTPDLNPDAARARVSAAARELAGARASKKRFVFGEEDDDDGATGSIWSKPEGGPRTDAADIEAARAARDQRMRDAWKTEPVPAPMLRSDATRRGTGGGRATAAQADAAADGVAAARARMLKRAQDAGR